MKYCTNCGSESIGRICTKCGAKQNTKHQFCGWCGEVLNPNAFICTNCKVRIKQGLLSKIFKIVGLLLIPVALLALLAGTNVQAKINGISFLISILILMPFIGNIIYSVTSKTSTRAILSVARVALVLFFILGIPALTDTSTPKEPESVQSRACTEAVEVFHQNVRLKNEKSFQLNKWNVMTHENYNDNENLTRYIVTIDYSAQNGFGGNSSDTYTVELVYDEMTDKFETLSAYE